MSYKHLTGRLIETQRSMIGEPAIRIAQSVDGITVSDGGAVKAIEGDGMEVVDDLAERYTTMLGGAAEQRLQAAADEFADELRLPTALGGPKGAAGTPTSGLASDGGTVATQQHAEAAIAAPQHPAADIDDADPTTSASPGEASQDSVAEAVEASQDSVAEAVEASEESVAETVDASKNSTVEPEDENDPGPTESDPVVCEYALASTLETEEFGELDLASVYLMPGDEDEWASPVTVETAVVEELSAATDLSDDVIETVLESIDSVSLFETLADESGETVSFNGEGITLTFHRSGSLAIY